MTISVALLGGPTIPGGSLGIVQWNAKTVGVTDRSAELGLSVSLLGVQREHTHLRLGVARLGAVAQVGEFLFGAGADVYWLVECAKFCTDGFDCSE